MTDKRSAAIAIVSRFSILVVLGITVNACGGVSTNPAPVCTGTTCACMAGASCDVSTQTCGASCTLGCAAQSTCAGACGDSCSVDCGEGASCSITLGASGSISCKANSSCHVTCVGDCSISCADTADCQIKCAGDAAFHDVNGGGSC